MTYDYYYYKVLYQENGIGYQNNWSLIYDIEVTIFVYQIKCNTMTRTKMINLGESFIHLYM